jgi:hypothetical protein
LEYDFELPAFFLFVFLLFLDLLFFATNSVLEVVLLVDADKDVGNSNPKPTRLANNKFFMVKV